MTDVIVECRGGVVQEVTVVGEPVRVVVLDWDDLEGPCDRAALRAWPVQRGAVALAPETKAALDRITSLAHA